MKKTILFFGLIMSIVPLYAQPFLTLTSGVTKSLTSLDFVDDNIGYACGQNGIVLKTTDGGVTWTNLPTGVSVELYEIDFKDANNGIVVGRSGAVLRTGNGGATWSSISPGTFDDLISVSYNGPDVYIGGYHQALYKSTNNGTTWNSLPLTDSIYTYSFYWLDTDTGYITGYKGKVMKTFDGGASWIDLPTGNTLHLLNSWFKNTNEGIVVGGDVVNNMGIIMKTTDGGANWSTMTIPDTYLAKIRFLDPDTGYIMGGDIFADTTTILKTINGGNTWEVLSTASNRQYGASFPSMSTGYTCGVGGSILKMSRPVSTGRIYHFTEKPVVVVYPHPSGGVINIAVKDEMYGNSNFIVTDITGKVYVSGWLEKEIDLSLLPRGTYFLKVYDKEHNFVERIILE